MDCLIIELLQRWKDGNLSLELQSGIREAIDLRRRLVQTESKRRRDERMVIGIDRLINLLKRFSFEITEKPYLFRGGL